MKKISSSKLFSIGAACFVTLVIMVFVVVAIFMATKTKDFVEGEGVVVSFNTSENSDGNTMYAPVVKYVYEGVTYQETASSSSSSRSYSIGETVKIKINPLIPREFAMDKDSVVPYIIFGFLSFIAYLLIAAQLVAPKLTKKFPLYNWSGLLLSPLFLFFPLGICYVIGHFSKGGFFAFANRAIWPYVFFLFMALGLLGFSWELVHALKLKYYRKRDNEKFERILNKDRKRLKSAGNFAAKMTDLAAKTGSNTQGAINYKNSIDFELNRLDIALDQQNAEQDNKDVTEKELDVTPKLILNAEKDSRKKEKGKFAHLNEQYLSEIKKKH